MKGVVRTAALFGAIAILVVLFSLLRSRGKSVETVTPQTRTVVESIAVTGTLRGRTETSVGAQINGRIAQMLVREGDHVWAGQPLARLDDAVARAQVDQASEAIRTAETQLAQAVDSVTTAEAQLHQTDRPTLASDIARVRADTAQNVAVAEAKLAGAKQRLAALQRGDTLEQRQQLEAQVEQAQASLELAQKDYARQQTLYRQGAVAPASLDSAEANRRVAQKTLDNLLARKRQQEIGPRAEDIAQAEADVRAAEATVTGAKATGEAQLRSLLAIPRVEDVIVARNRLREAERARLVAQSRLRESRMALDVERRRLSDALVTAPFAGTVTQIVTEVGGVTAANQPLVRLVRTARPEIRADTDEKYLGKLRLGQEAVVTADAFPDQEVRARIREIGAQVDKDRGTIEVRLNPLSTPAWLRPNQTLSVNILVDRGSPRLVVPLSAVTMVGGTAWVLVVENGVVRRRPIEAGAVGTDGVPVRAGLTARDQVVLQPVGLEAGERVRATPRNAASAVGSDGGKG